MRTTGRALVATTALAPAAWGLTYIVTTELLPPGRPLLTGVLRALPAGLLLAAGARQRPTGAWWGRALVLGTLNIGGFFALLFVAAYRLPGGVAATLGAVQPLIAAALGAALLRERAGRRTVAAGTLGILGVALLVLRSGARLDPLGVGAGLAGAVSMASGVVLTKRWGRPVPLLAFTSWQLIAGGLVLLPVALAVEGLPPALTGEHVVGYLWLATGGTAVAYCLWFRGVGRLPVARVSLLGLLSPLVATLAGWVVLDQALAPPQLAGAALVLAGVGLGQHEGRGPRVGIQATVNVAECSRTPSRPVPFPPAPPPVASTTSTPSTRTSRSQFVATGSQSSYPRTSTV
jgi:probable blue pigment (indigoidine) exporter